jgi:hypothetical protein
MVLIKIMGCGLSQVQLTQLDPNLDHVEIAQFDKVFEAGALQVRSLNSSVSQLHRPLEAFQRASGLLPDASVGFGIICLLVAASADCEGDMIGTGFRLMEHIPGFSLETSHLNTETLECYEAWRSLMAALESILKTLESSHDEMILGMERVKQVPDLMLQMAYREQWDVTRYSELSMIAEANSLKLDYCVETLGSMMQTIREISYQLAYTVEHLSRQDCMSMLNILGLEARERSLLTPAVVHDTMKQEITEAVASLTKAN